MPHVVIRQDGKVQNIVDLLGREAFVLGRQGDAVLGDARISREQAKLVREADGGYALENLGSQSRTKLNGLEIDRERLNDGDEIQIFGFTIVFNAGPMPKTELHKSDPVATDVTGIGAMTFQDGGGDLAEKLRGMLNQAKQNQASEQHQAAGKPRPAAGAASGVTPEASPAQVENQAHDAATTGTNAAGKNKLLLGVLLGAVVMMALALAAALLWR